MAAKGPRRADAKLFAQAARLASTAGRLALTCVGVCEWLWTGM